MIGSALSGASSEETFSTKQFRQPIQFDPSKPNLLLLADEETGTLALCSHEQMSCNEQQVTKRLLVNVQPRCLLVPTINAADGRGSGPLLSHCVVKCPAPVILVSLILESTLAYSLWLSLDHVFLLCRTRANSGFAPCTPIPNYVFGTLTTAAVSKSAPHNSSNREHPSL